MQIFNAPNINILWSRLIVEELVRNGVTDLCLAPGSRSAPLAIAANEHPDLQTIVHFDERGLGFFALGLISATRKPVAVLTTSGTAVANLLPSIIEASKKKLPLIILTADRPPELRFTGANQTIDQVKIFGDYVRFFFDLPCPTIDIAPTMVLTTVDQLISRSQGDLPGPVHLNVMFREPLSQQVKGPVLNSPDPQLKSWLNTKSPYTTYLKASLDISPGDVQTISPFFSHKMQGVITVGKLATQKDMLAVSRLADHLKWPVFADVTSGLVLGHSSKYVIRHFDFIYKATQLNQTPFNVVLHLGGRLTSQAMNQYLKNHPDVKVIMAINHPLRHDPEHRVNMRIQAPIHRFCDALCAMVPLQRASTTFKTLQQQDSTVRKVIKKVLGKHTDQISEPALASVLCRLLPKHAALFVGNSMPIRDLDLFADLTAKGIHITANRGASGIDGNIATAIGFAMTQNHITTALIGDLTALHDLNSLALSSHLKKPFVLIIINNNGGGIFSFLPVATEAEHFEKCFVTPHHLNFKSAAQMFGFKYYSLHTQNEFQKRYHDALKHPGCSLLEVFTNQADYCAIQENIKVQLNLNLK